MHLVPSQDKLMTRRRWLSSAAMLAAYAGAMNASAPPGVEDIAIRSSLDHELQQGWFLPPRTKDPSPLLVHLHSWSATFNKSTDIEVAIAESANRGWAFVSPNFRGPNNRPQACASKYAIQDVLDAVSYVRKRHSIDMRRIYLLGGSGGGHMTLMMATVKPQLWAAASSWVPIVDLAAWYSFSKQQNSRYFHMMEQCCGGSPGSSRAVDAEYRARSPLFRLGLAAGLPIDIEVGIHDGHTGSVPVSQSLRAFNALAAANGQPTKQLENATIDSITREARLPAGLASEPIEETGRKRAAIFRRTAGSARVTIFEGTHEMDFRTAIEWLDGRRRV
jgi:poly(3-hydroxybutyrate) depolymerase